MAIELQARHMRVARPGAILVALSIWSYATVASPQQTPGANDSIDTVEVTAQREAKRQAIRTFVSNVTRFDGEDIARWRFPICPSVTGAVPEYGEFMRARIVEIARTAGAPVARNQAKCRPNLTVILTSQPNELWATLKKREPQMFSSLQAPAVERALSARPVQIVQNAVLHNSDGTTSFNTTSHRLKDSRIHSSVTEDFTSAVVVVNDAETGRANFGQLSDYVGMAALARVDLTADFADADSILRLFAKPDSNTSVPAGLTEWDRQFLKTLYGTDNSSQRSRALISTAMIGSLAPD